jgi:hypothetical protein
VLLEVETQIEDWFPQRTGGAQQKCDEQPAQAAIAIEERMNRLELHVDQPGLDKQREARAFVVQKQFERAHAIEDHLGRRRHEGRIPGASAADPILTAPEFTRLFFAAPALRQQYFVNLP